MILIVFAFFACLVCGIALWLVRNRTSLRVQVTSLALFTSLASITAVGLLACWASSNALVDQRREALEGLLQARGDAVTSYLNNIEHQVKVFSSNLLVAEATRDFAAAFSRLPEQAEAGAGDRNGPAAQAMARYFDGPFQSGLLANGQPQAMARYFDGPFQSGLLANGQPYRGAAAYQPSTEAGRILQAQYIASNPHPVGAKLNLDASSEKTDYNRHHARYHPSLRDHLESFGFYDVFLFNTEGDLIYSVFKETDFGTNLLEGPYAKTNFGEVVAKCLRSNNPNEVVILDFAEYEPSYGNPASFVGSPVFLDGERIGVAVFQIPVEKINEIVLAGEGLGDSGLAYFVGSDRRMRSVARDESLADALMTGPIETEAVERAIRGESSTVVSTGILGEETLAVFGPLEIDGLAWNLVIEVPMEEVLHPSRVLAYTIFLAAALLAIPVVIYALFMARTVVLPVRRLTDTMKDFAEGDADLTQRVDESRGDELGELARWFNVFVLRIHDLVAEAVSVSRNVEAAAVSIESNLGAMSSGLEEQRGQTTQVVTRVAELTHSVEEVASRASEASLSATRAGERADGGRTVVDRTVRTIESIADVVSSSSLAVDGLRGQAEDIGKVIDVINDIADQTNLLALNAAIEAARAGEHGRGFAVVADEVRKLAERTTHATKEVAESIKSIQKQTGDAVEGMSHGKDRVGESVSCANEAGDALLAIVEGSRQVAELIRGMASSTAQQAAAAEEMSKNLEGITAVTQRSADGAVAMVTSAKHLRDKSESLTRLMSAFTIADSTQSDETTRLKAQS